MERGRVVALPGAAGGPAVLVEHAHQLGADPAPRAPRGSSRRLGGTSCRADGVETEPIAGLGLTLTQGQPSTLVRMTTKPAIEIAGLQKSFGEVSVLNGVDLAVAPGSIFALLGSNGAGKTTTVKILSTLLKADGGTATVCGFDVATQCDQVRESISLTGQFAAVDEILTGRENLVLVARLRRVPDPGRVAEDLLDRFSLTDAGGRRVATYSGGMRRRLDIAMSLIGSPPVIFLDEPTTGLDPQARIEVWKAVKELANNGTTVLLTTQYLEEAEQLADRIAILHEGRIIANGTLAELKQMFPPAEVEYVEKQPSLEEIFLAITSTKETR
jgi:ABC-2 type transport system ATP-binding protein